MGATLSREEGSREDGVHAEDHPGTRVKQRIELLEELCSSGDTDRRVRVLQQLSEGQNTRSGPVDDAPCAGVVLPTAPSEFQPGRLIAAGCAGRVYAGTYCGQPAALKVLILDEETAHEILNEVRLCLKLQHRNLVQLLDCAVVATSRHGAPTATSPGPGSPTAAAASHHSLLPVFGGSSSGGGGRHHGSGSMAASPCQYLPVMRGEQLAPCSSAGSSGGVVPAAAAAAVLAGAHSPSAAAPQGPGDASKLPALASSLNHACFEVWIAMELCDGGTLSEQLQSGFHHQPGSRQVDMEQLLPIALDIARALSYMHAESVCHGDLKADNVLLKTTATPPGPDTAYGSTCSSSGADDCTWLGMLCSTSGSTTCTCPRSRRFSSDSCWSCYSKASQCLESPCSHSSSTDTNSSGSNTSTPALGRRSRGAGLSRAKSHLLSGLCCMSPASGVTELEELEQERPRPHEDAERVAGSCIFCGCSVMTLEPSERAGTSRAPTPAGDDADEPPRAPRQQQAQQQQRQQEQEQEARQWQPPLAGGQGSAAGEQACEVVPLGAGALAAVCAPADECGGYVTVPAAGAGAACRQPVLSALPPVHESAGPGPAWQVLQADGTAHAGRIVVSQQQQHSGSGRGADEPPEEEHVAPLSLYMQARQRRRSRCLAPGALLPAALAAAAAAASSGWDGASSPGSVSTSTSDEEGGTPAKHGGAHAAAAALPAGPHPCTASSAAAAAAAGVAWQPTAAAAGVAWQPTAAAAAANGSMQLDSSPVDVYASSAARRPPLPSRVRRHSFCYGSTASYGGVSAAAAATAIAAAAEAVRADSSMRAAAAAGGDGSTRRRRDRRMSWDDRLLRQTPPARGMLSSLLGVALPALSRTSSDVPGLLGASSAQQQQQQAGREPGRRTRRHSWAGYLQCEAFPASMAAAGRAPPHQLQQQQAMWQQPQQLGSGSGRAGRRTRRHSWAGYGADAVSAGPSLGKLASLRALSSCFAPGAADGPQGALFGAASSYEAYDGGDGLLSVSGRGDTHALLLQDFDSGGMLPNSSASFGLQGSGRSPLCHASSDRLELQEEGDCGGLMGCLPRWCVPSASSGPGSAASSGTCSGAAPPRRGSRQRRRHSWCCVGADDGDADLWAAGLDAADGESSTNLALLSSAGPASVPLLPRGEALECSRQPPWDVGRSRRCSWDLGYGAGGSSGSAYAAVTCQRSVVFGRPAYSLDARVNTPDSWCSSVPASGSTPSGALLLRSRSGDGRGGLLAGLGEPLLGNRGADEDSCIDGSSSSGGSANGGGSSSNTRSGPAASRSASKQSPPTLQKPGAADTQQQWHGDQLLGDACCPDASAQPPVWPPPPPPGQQLQQWQAKDADAGHTSVAVAASGCMAAAATMMQPSSAQQQQQQPPTLDAASPSGLARRATPAATAAGMAAAAQDEDGSLEAGGPFVGSFPMPPRLARAAGEPAAAPRGPAGAVGGRGRRWSTGVAAEQLLMRKRFLELIGGSDGSDGAAAAGAGAAAAAAPARPGAAGDADSHSLAPSSPAAPGSGAAPASPDVPSRPRSSGPGSASGSVSSSSQAVPLGSSLHTSAGSHLGFNVLGMPRRTVALAQRRMSYDTATGAYQVVSSLEAEELMRALAGSPGSPGGTCSPQQQQQQQQQQVEGEIEVAPSAAQDLVLDPPGGGAPAGDQQQQHQHQQPECSPDALDRLDDAQRQQCLAQMQRLLEALAKKGYGGLDSSGLPASLDATASHNATEHADAATASPVAGGTLPGQAASPSPPPPQRQQHVMHTAPYMPPPPRVHYCAKVCDFGYSKCLRAGQSHCSTANAGTLTHQAPEVLRHGHLSPAADIYAFGIILWELFTCERPFRGLLEGDLVVGVCDQGLRPVFPSGCAAPTSYVTLAQQCWAEDPAQRPTAVQLVRRLNELLYEERRARLKASAGASGAAPAAGPCPSSGKDAKQCRRRRHSMPVGGVGAPGGPRQRRRSRRFSLFLLPFSRQPAVPEDAPLEDHLIAWRGSASGSHAMQHLSGGGLAASCTGSSSSGSHVLHPASSCGGAGGGGSASCSGNVVVSAGGLLGSGSFLSRLRGSASLSGGHAAPVSGGGAAAGTSTSGAAGGARSAAAAEEAGDGSEWFQSFT